MSLRVACLALELKVLFGKTIRKNEDEFIALKKYIFFNCIMFPPPFFRVSVWSVSKLGTGIIMVLTLDGNSENRGARVE